MRIGSVRDLGLYVRDRRRELGLTQTGLAAEAGVSRRWLSDLEAGKESAEVGLVLRTLAALNLMVDAVPLETLPGTGVDLDDLLRRLGPSDG
ncbi:HTH-type transcriptional regulator / antitoxin HipB [Micromonospora rhizosphaerae]|uniref:HTH-type transcriptional regulator / antitoxin HipB n=1 Tax=Micromonospora rhizosphaerae TaxID=568872 RepID=A0A1C6T7Q3_9ACTN|nr:helix-turn-helix domain-containing protein [Micromonospora rhizosphaerae]SCL37846.1 HTH-type transcriptional regulator / antitoxin HipB [Micromonospora rhizosphaerae]